MSTHHNSQVFKGNVTIEDALKIVSSVQTPPSGTTDLALDWSTNSLLIVDLSSMPGESLNIRFTGDSTSNALSRLMFIQPAVVCTVAMPEDGTYTHKPDPTLSIIASINTIETVTVLDMIYDGSPVPATAFVGTYHILNVGTGSYSENTDYLTEVLALGATGLAVAVNGESYTKTIARLDYVIGQLLPGLPPLLSVMSLSITTTTISTAKKASDGIAVTALVIGTNVSAVLTGVNSGKFYDPANGNLQVLLDTNTPPVTIKGDIALTANDDSGTNGALQIVSNTAYDAFNNDIQIALTLADGDTPTGDTNEHRFQVIITGSTSDAVTVVKTFYKDTLQAQAPPTSVSIVSGAALGFVSGIPALITGDARDVAATYNNVVTEFYNAAKIASLSNAAIDTVDAVLSGVQTADTAVVRQDSVTINAGAYTLAFTVSVESFRPNGSSNGSVQASPALNMLADAVTDTTKFGYDHNTSLQSRATDLLILNGLVQYPAGDFSNFDDGTGTAAGATKDYSALAGTRYIEIDVGSASNKSGVDITFSGQSGFTNAAIEADADYALEIEYEHPTLGTIVIDGNAAYPGVGVPGDGDPALDLASSSQTLKKVTFGEVVSTVLNPKVRVKLSGGALQFSQDITAILY